MRAAPFLPVAILVAIFLHVSHAWEDSEGDYDDENYSWNPPQTTARPRPPRPSTTTGRPRDSSTDEWCYPVAERIYSQLMRQSNGNPMSALASLEGRYNVRVAQGASAGERLNVVVQAANSRLASSGYASYRPVVAAVADKLAEQLAESGDIRVNLRPASAGSGLTATLSFGPPTNTNNNVRPSNAGNNWWGEGGSQGTQRTPPRTGGYRRPMGRSLGPEEVIEGPVIPVLSVTEPTVA